MGWHRAGNAHARARGGVIFPRAITYPARDLTGLVRTGDGTYTEYTDARRDYWRKLVMPALKRIPLKAWVRDTGKSAVILIDARLGRRRPRARHQALLIAYAKKRGVL